MIIHTLDLRFQNQPGLVAAFLVESGTDLALVETGPAATLPTLLGEIRSRGFKPEAIRHVLVTHIHLDHAGAAGWWAREGATVFVHPRGAPHLVDPEKLVASARRIYGDRFDALWGEMLPAPAGNIVALGDGETVKIGKIRLTAVDTPGHARHHHAYACGPDCFTGDVAGARLQGSPYLSVTAAPPQFDPVAYHDSITRLHGAGFQRLFLTHFGEVADVSRHLADYAERVGQVTDEVAQLLADGLRGDDLRAAYTGLERSRALRSGATAADWERYELLNSSAMCADGIALFLEKNAGP